MRIFAGLELPDGARAAAARLAMEAQVCMPGRYVQPENYHVTLAYIGEADDATCAEAADALREAACALRGRQVICALTQARYFKRREHAILYCAVRSDPGVAYAAQAVRTALGARDVPFDPAPFVPHVTLARGVCVDEAALERLKLTPQEWQIGQLTLFESARVDGELRYTPILRAMLEEEGAP